MFEFAKKQNVLACFETGAGKTLVAVLLIQHMHYQEQMRLKAAEEKARLGLTEQPKRKICVFLVNLVNLVHQQSAVLEKNTKLRVQRLFGDVSACEAPRGCRVMLTDRNAARNRSLERSSVELDG